MSRRTLWWIYERREKKCPREAPGGLLAALLSYKDRFGFIRTCNETFFFICPDAWAKKIVVLDPPERHTVFSKAAVTRQL
jgi:hypothetical protein